MPNEPTHFPPLGEVVAVDPYPWHGLVVLRSGGSGYRLIPHDGRSERDLPAWSGSSSFKGHPYQPADAGILWDIGNDDPPVTPLIEEAGGTAWARRIVSPEVSLRLPARIGGVTHQVSLYVQPFFPAVTTVGQLMMEVDGGDPVVAGTFDLADDFGAGLDQLYRQGTDQIIDTGNPLTWSCIAMPMDASPDGARRLFGVRLTNTGVSFLADTALVGVFEVFLDADSELGITADIVIRKAAEDCLGVYERSGSNDLYYEVSEQSPFTSDGAPCSISYRLEEAPPGIPPVAGNTDFEESLTGLILGASYVGGEIDYHLLDRTYRRTVEVSWSRETDNGTWIDMLPPSCSVPSRSDRVTVHVVETTSTATLHRNGQSVTVTRNHKGGLTWTTSFTSSGLVDDITSRWGEETLDGLSRTDLVGEGGFPIARAVEDPTPHALCNYPGSWGGVLVHWRRRWLTWSAVWTGYHAQGPLLHDGGVLGDWVVTSAPSGTDYSPRCAVCPITGAAVRAVDLPGVTSVAYI